MDFLNQLSTEALEKMQSECSAILEDRYAMRIIPPEEESTVYQLSEEEIEELTTAANILFSYNIESFRKEQLDELQAYYTPDEDDYKGDMEAFKYFYSQNDEIEGIALGLIDDEDERCRAALKFLFEELF